MYNLEDTIEKGDVLCPGYNILRLEEKDFSVFPGHRRRRLCSACSWCCAMTKWA